MNTANRQNNNAWQILVSVNVEAIHKINISSKIRCVNCTVSIQMYKAQARSIIVRRNKCLPSYGCAEIWASLKVVWTLSSCSNKHFWLFSMRPKMSYGQFFNEEDERNEQLGLFSLISLYMPHACMFLRQVRLQTHKKVTDWVSCCKRSTKKLNE